MSNLSFFQSRFGVGLLVAGRANGAKLLHAQTPSSHTNHTDTRPSDESSFLAVPSQHWEPRSHKMYTFFNGFGVALPGFGRASPNCETDTLYTI